MLWRGLQEVRLSSQGRCLGRHERMGGRVGEAGGDVLVREGGRMSTVEVLTGPCQGWTSAGEPKVGGNVEMWRAWVGLCPKTSTNQQPPNSGFSSHPNLMLEMEHGERVTKTCTWIKGGTRPGRTAYIDRVFNIWHLLHILLPTIPIAMYLSVPFKKQNVSRPEQNATMRRKRSI
jgi:hypothetical protein